MSRLVSYEELVDVLRAHLRAGVSGLITGVSENQHSFQIGLKEGRIVMLTYRIFKGVKALEMLVKIDQAKIIDHLNIDPPGLQPDLPDTSTILTTLAIERGISGAVAEVGGGDDLTIPDSAPPPAPEIKVAQTPAQVAPPSGQQNIHPSQLEAIKKAAIHYFGPIGAMVCDDYLTPGNLGSVEIRTLLMRIANDVGASESDTQAFIDQVS